MCVYAETAVLNDFYLKKAPRHHYDDVTKQNITLIFSSFKITLVYIRSLIALFNTRIRLHS